MARRPRIEIAGYYHIINRGVEQRVIFKEASDYEYFEELMCFYMKSYGITLHNYCLMSNHYHLLIETSTDNLSKFMRQLNMNYAIYFNKKYKRVGHLWQGRFKCKKRTKPATHRVCIRPAKTLDIRPPMTVMIRPLLLKERDFIFA